MPICVRMAPGVEVLIQLLDEPPGLCGPVSGLLSGVHKAIRYLHARTGWGGVLQGLNAIAIRNLLQKNESRMWYPATQPKDGKGLVSH